MFKVTFKASKLEFLCPSEQECELWVSKISEASQFARLAQSHSPSKTQNTQFSNAATIQSLENMSVWKEDRSTMFSQEENSFMRSASPSAQRPSHDRRVNGLPHTVSATSVMPPQPDFARKLQNNQDVVPGSGSVGGLGISVIMHQTGYPLVLDLDPSGPAAQSKRIFPGVCVLPSPHVNKQTRADTASGHFPCHR
jgi:hypothetical protein